MKLFYTIGFLLLLAFAPLARAESLLARVTGYWGTGAGASGKYAASSGARLHTGNCAVDPKRIPYGSKVIFPDVTCVAVDTGPAVVSRKSARVCGRTAAQRNAIVIDRFFETRQEAIAWSKAHPQFMTLQVVQPGSHPAQSLPAMTKSVAKIDSSPFLCVAGKEYNGRRDDLVASLLFNWSSLLNWRQ